MTVNGIIALIATLEAQQFADIEGTPESEWVDFKRIAYAAEAQHPLRLSERGRWELCKDVTAFANSLGGCIVLGFPEVANPTLGVKVAGTLMPIRVDTVDLVHYRDVLERGVYPPPEGIELRWFVTGHVTGSQQPAGALLIHVPPSVDRPLVLRKIVTEQDDSIHAVGVPVRNADRTTWYQAERVHHLLRQGERMSSVVEPSSSGPDEAVLQRAQEDIDQLIRLQEWNDKPVLFLQAIPGGGPRRLPEFYDVVKESLERPASLRPLGFNLRSLGGVADVVSGALVVRRMEEAAARLAPDGLFTVGGLVSPDFLGWSINPSSDRETLRMNPTTLIELTLESCRFVDHVLRPRAGSATWRYRVDCQSFQTHHVVLAPGPTAQSVGSWEWKMATADEWRRELLATGQPARDAFDLAVETYALFGLPETAIPYAAEGEISAEVIQALNRSPN